MSIDAQQAVSWAMNQGQIETRKPRKRQSTSSDNQIDSSPVENEIELMLKMKQEEMKEEIALIKSKEVERNVEKEEENMIKKIKQERLMKEEKLREKMMG